ncbi:unnamed protein product [Bursaphelenchus xylophilus]|uniref:(pine wood nematode) hypothetical protein n=1 Tax=Bursaphelenchus xylophilus TaxID=6326 RepID=A0A7I8WYT5_BURXY|nr:unnamed protein product [Bursaphelenchus xylophilus]CAG9101600.1 unnamed protein product [Bursaphelenchus xylophilus]
MTFRAVAFLLLWQVVAPYNGDSSTFLMDKCDPGMICHELGVDSFQDYAVEFVWVPDGLVAKYDFVQWKNLKVTERLTQGDDWSTKRISRSVCRHPIPGADNKMFIEFSSERVEVIKFYEEGKHLAVDKRGNKLFRIMSDFIDRQHISVENLKHSVIYNSWIFLNATHAIDLKRYMYFDPAETYKLRTHDDVGRDRPGRINKPYWSYGMEHVHSIPNEDIPIEFVDMITRNCFGNPNRYCAIDPRDGTIHYTPYPAVLRMGDFIMEQRWQEVLNDFVPVYRFHHLHMPENEVFYYSNVKELFFELLKHGKPKDPDINRRWIRGVMPQPKEGDKIFELMMQRTTTTPPPIQSTTPPTSTLKPLPLDAYKPIEYLSIDEMEEEPMPTPEIASQLMPEFEREVDAASDLVRNSVAILLAVFMITV